MNRYATAGATINTPGQLPTRIRSTYGGGYTIERPGELPITIRPSYESSTTTAAQAAAYLYPAYYNGRTNQQNRVSGKGKR